VIAHNLFEMMQVTIGAVGAFSLRAVVGLSANREKAEAWLALNASLVTVLNPLIGYVQGAQLVKEAQERSLPILTVALEKAKAGTLRHRQADRAVHADEITAAFRDLRRFTEAGILTRGEQPDPTTRG
jgi:fumarate hydratase class II